VREIEPTRSSRGDDSSWAEGASRTAVRLQQYLVDENDDGISIGGFIDALWAREAQCEGKGGEGGWA
jgi:hypothetical protein